MFQYFVATAKKELDDSLVLPFAHVGKRSEFRFAPTVRGPGGLQGIYLSLNQHPFDLQIHNQADWQPMSNERKTWVRMHQQPEPAQMERPSLLDGYWVRMADGKQWLIPRALQWTSLEHCTPSLPRYDQFDGESGQWASGELLPAYRRLWEVTGQVLEYLEGDRELSATEEVESVVEALTVHYRMGPIECSLAKLLTVQVRIAVWSAMIDRQGLDQLKKNAADAGSNSPNGESAALSDTSQAMPIC